MSSVDSVDSTRCLFVEKNADTDVILRGIKQQPIDELRDGYVRVEVAYSSINYKDALCATGHPGVAKSLPIIPGIDAAGKVVAGGDPDFTSGDLVMVFHAAFGTEVNGGLSQYLDVPKSWVYKIPEPLDARNAMAIGTGGFTAAQCVDELIKHNVTPDKGEIVVSGATGGVGIFAVGILSKLGYSVVASTGKAARQSWLKKFGANRIIDRASLNDASDRPLLGGQWAGAVDTVGGNTLATVIRATQPQGCVTACGLVGGATFDISVYPFILRGITLQGIDTACISREYRSAIWQRIATDWKIDGIEELIIEVDLDGVEEKIQKILAGEIAGRVVVRLNN